MKLFKYICGADEKYGPAADEQDAYKRKEQVDPNFHYLEPRIEEVVIPGYEITLTPLGDDIDSWDKARCREYLNSKGVEYAPQTGVEKLREAVRANP